MSLKPINQEQVQQASQVMLAYLDDGANTTPNNLVEGIVSGKSLLRGIINGSLIVCQKEATSPAPQQEVVAAEEPEAA
jgi:hypothetical protein